MTYEGYQGLEDAARTPEAMKRVLQDMVARFGFSAVAAELGKCGSISSVCPACQQRNASSAASSRAALATIGADCGLTYKQMEKNLGG